jgi:hypothetical protein
MTTNEGSSPMAAQAQSSSKHLGAARELLQELEGETDPQVKATAAAAHATLVLAEQVAVARVMMATDAVSPAAHQPSAQ